MRTSWRVLTSTIFWSFERGTWPYDVAVALIVVFVLLSPRSWFHDRPPVGPPPAPTRRPTATRSASVYLATLPSASMPAPASRRELPELILGLKQPETAVTS